ncbi:MAG: helix-turn-helix domain-containing protein [Haloarculaceae archaeon]
MTGGIHAEVAVGDTQLCQVSPYSNREGKTVTSVTKSRMAGEAEQLTEEFTLIDDTVSIEADGGQTLAEERAERLFKSSQKEVFRFRRQTPQHCVCERIESHDCPIRNVEALDGTLYVTFVTPDHETLQAVLQELARRYDSMSVCRLLQTEENGGTEQSTIVDIGALTERQREVLSTAHELGYFEHPRDVSAATVADELNIVASTFSEHLAAAQRNLLDELLGG